MARSITDIVNEGEALGVVGGMAASVPAGGQPGVTDADGNRIPLTDESGTVMGYVGYSVGGGLGVGIWAGDADGAVNFDTALVSIDGGQVYIQNTNGTAWLTLSSDGTVTLGGSSIKFSPGAAGFDGDDTPSTVAQLADVLVAAGIIASHTIT